MNLGKLLGALRAYRAGAPLGDVVMLKLDALSSVGDEINQKLDPLRGYAPELDLAALRKLPAGTLGREYARFLDANGIDPLAVGESTRERFRDRPWVLRYTLTHDLHHTLTGFDAGLAGEIGVFAFTVGQGSAPVGSAWLHIACCVYTLVSPTQARRIWHNARVGLAMGKQADLAIAAPLESWCDEPLGDVRAKLHIEEPRQAGVLPSKSSVVAALFYPKSGGPRQALAS